MKNTHIAALVALAFSQISLADNIAAPYGSVKADPSAIRNLTAGQAAPAPVAAQPNNTIKTFVMAAPTGPAPVATSNTVKSFVTAAPVTAAPAPVAVPAGVITANPDFIKSGDKQKPVIKKKKVVAKKKKVAAIGDANKKSINATGDAARKAKEDAVNNPPKEQEEGIGGFFNKLGNSLKQGHAMTREECEKVVRSLVQCGNYR